MCQVMVRGFPMFQCCYNYIRGRKRVHPGAASMCQVMVCGFPMFQCYYNYIRGRKRVHPGAASCAR